MGRQPDRAAALQGGQLGTAGIVFTVLAFVTPIGAVVGIVPFAIAIGNGVGVPGAYVVTGVILLCFGAGYAAMSKHVTNAGAFYAYIARGLGRPAGVAAAYASVVAYNAIACLVAAGLGFFAHEIGKTETGLDLPWFVWMLIGLVAIGILGRRQVEISAVVLGIALVVECGILLVLDVAIFANKGLTAVSFDSFAPAHVFSGALGITLVFAFNNYIGFESTAILSEEAKDPHRTIPRATYAAVILITVFYAVTTWALITGAGGSQAPQVAGKAPDVFVFALNEQYVGHLSTVAMEWLVISSLFAALLATHNGTARYFFSLGRDGLLPQALARTLPSTGAPHVASALQIAIVLVVVGSLGLAGMDPLQDILPLATGLGTLGIVALQATAAVAVVVFFRRRRDPRWVTTLIAPSLGAAGLITGAVLIVRKYSLLSGHAAGVTNQLPWLLVVAAVLGAAYSLWLRANRPEVYAGLAESHEPQPGSDPIKARILV